MQGNGMDQFEQVGRAQIHKGYACHVGEFGFYPIGSEKPLTGFKWNDMGFQSPDHTKV